MVGDVACYQDRLEDARDAFRKQLVRASSVDDSIGVVDGVAGEAVALAYQGRFDLAVELTQDLSRLAANIGAPTYRAYAIYATGEAMVAENPKESAALLEQAAELAGSVNNQFIQALARTSRGSVLSWIGRHEEAVFDLHEAAELWEGLVVPSYQWTVVQYLGAILAELGENQDAIRLLSAAATAGKRPFAAGQSHWREAVARLEEDPEYELLRGEGAGLDLASATELALDRSRTATRQRR